MTTNPDHRFPKISFHYYLFNIVQVRREPHLQAEVVGQKEQGAQVRGADLGDWVQLSGGQGFMLKLLPTEARAAQENTLVAYFDKTVAPASRRRELAISAQDAQLDLPRVLVSAHKKWSVDPHKFTSSMSVASLVVADGVPQGSGVLAAFVKNEVRGVGGPSQRPIPFSPRTRASVRTTC